MIISGLSARPLPPDDRRLVDNYGRGVR